LFGKVNTNNLLKIIYIVDIALNIDIVWPWIFCCYFMWNFYSILNRYVLKHVPITWLMESVVILKLCPKSWPFQTLGL